MLFADNLELFAEVASFLHLVIYAGICLALLRFRRKRPFWYLPTFQVPAGRILAAVGAVSCLGLIFFMEPLSIWIGLSVTAVAVAYYWLFQRGTELPPPRPAHVDVSIREASIVAAVDITKDDNEIPAEILRTLQTSRVLLLGYKEIPEQTEPEQSEEKYGEEAKERLDKMAEDMRQQNIDIDKDLVFTKNLAETISRVVEDWHCQAILTARPIHVLERLVVPVYDPSQVNTRLMTILRRLAESKSVEIVVGLMAEEDEEEFNEERLKAAIEQQFTLAGLEVYRYKNQSRKGKSAKNMMEELVEETDLVVLSESDSSHRKSFFNRIHQQIVKAVSAPVMVVLKGEGRDVGSGVES